MLLSLLSSFALFWENLMEPLGEQRKRGWERTAGTAAATVLRLYGPQVVKHADEAANAYQIFIRAGEPVQLVREDEIVGAGAVTLHGLFRSDALSLCVSRLPRSFAMPATNTPFLFDLHALSCEHHRFYVCPWTSVFHVFIWLIGWAVRWWVCTVVVAVNCVKPDRPQSTSLAAADSMGEISASSPSTAMVTACESPRARCTLRHPFTVRGWLPISPMDTCARTREHKRVPRWTHKVSKHRKAAQRGMPTLLFTHCCVGQNMMQRCITPASSCNMLSALVPNINPWIKTCGS